MPNLAVLVKLFTWKESESEREREREREIRTAIRRPLYFVLWSSKESFMSELISILFQATELTLTLSTEIFRLIFNPTLRGSNIQILRT